MSDNKKPVPETLRKSGVGAGRNDGAAMNAAGVRVGKVTR